jgi:hypothetical protein
MITLGGAAAAGSVNLIVALRTSRISRMISADEHSPVQLEVRDNVG